MARGWDARQIGVNMTKKTAELALSCKQFADKIADMGGFNLGGFDPGCGEAGRYCRSKSLHHERAGQ